MDAAMENEFRSLIREAERLVQLNDSAHHVIVVKTAKDNVYHFAYYVLSGDPEGENYEETYAKFRQDDEEFIQKLLHNDDSEVKYVVCMFQKCRTLRQPPFAELPSFDFRKRLLTANPKNAEALILFWANWAPAELHCRTIQSVMPEKVIQESVGKI